MKNSKKLKWITGVYELIFGFPIFGGILMVSLLYLPLFLGIILHAVSLSAAAKNNERIEGNIMGIVASVLGWIPFTGMVLHIITATFLLADAYEDEEEEEGMPGRGPRTLLRRLQKRKKEKRAIKSGLLPRKTSHTTR